MFTQQSSLLGNSSYVVQSDLSAEKVRSRLLVNLLGSIIQLRSVCICCRTRSWCESMWPRESKTPSALLKCQLSSSYVLSVTHSSSHTFSFLTVPRCAVRRGCCRSVRPEWKLFRVGPSPHECWRDVYMWLGVASGHTDTLQTPAE